MGKKVIDLQAGSVACSRVGCTAQKAVDSSRVGRAESYTLNMDSIVANKFISSLSKSLQALCHVCVDFHSGIEIVGYININIDKGSKVDYVLNEQLTKNASNSMTFVSNTYLAKKDEGIEVRDAACSPVAELQQSLDTPNSNLDRGSRKRASSLKSGDSRCSPKQPRKSHKANTTHVTIKLEVEDSNDKGMSMLELASEQQADDGIDCALTLSECDNEITDDYENSDSDLADMFPVQLSAESEPSPSNAGLGQSFEQRSGQNEPSNSGINCHRQSPAQSQPSLSTTCPGQNEPSNSGINCHRQSPAQSQPSPVQSESSLSSVCPRQNKPSNLGINCFHHSPAQSQSSSVQSEPSLLSACSDVDSLSQGQDVNADPSISGEPSRLRECAETEETHGEPEEGGSSTTETTYHVECAETTEVKRDETTVCPPPAVFTIRQTLGLDWRYTFQMPWAMMTYELSQCILEGRRPSPRVRREFVRIVVEDIAQAGFVNPTRKQLAGVAQTVVGLYPRSFSDTVNPSIMGHASLLNQLKSRFENRNRGKESMRRRSSRIVVQSNGSFPRTQSKHGCINWKPLQLPANMDLKMLHGIQQSLIEQFEKSGPDGGDDDTTGNKMASTYYLQRRDINTPPLLSIREIKEKWPFLFTHRYFFDHFKSLVGFDPRVTLKKALEDKGSNIIKMFRQRQTKSRSRIHNILDDYIDSADLIPIKLLRIMLAFFGEDEEALFCLAKPTETHNEVVHRTGLNGFPRLIIQGTSLSSGKGWMLTTEGQLLLQSPDTSFIDGIAALFASYFILNLEYQNEASITLDFLQRYFFEIIAEGTRCEGIKTLDQKTGKVVERRCKMSAKVVSLMKLVTDFDIGVVQDK